MAGVLLLLVGIYITFALYGPGQMMFPPVEPTHANVDIRARGDLSPYEKDELVSRVERRILGMPEIESVYARTGGAMEGPKDTIGSVRLTFVDWQERRTAEDILQEIRGRVADIPGIVVIDLRVPQHGPAARSGYRDRVLLPLCRSPGRHGGESERRRCKKWRACAIWKTAAACPASSGGWRWTAPRRRASGQT